MLELDITPAQLNQRVRPWSDADHRRFGIRVALFKRRGLTEDEAEQVADRLSLRDQDRDDRRMCIECSQLQRSGGCFAARQGWIPGADRRLTPLPFMLQRCHQFDWVKPS